MQTIILRTWVLVLVVFGFAASAAAQTAVRGDLVYTMAGDPIPNGVVLLRDGKIERVGPSAQVQIPKGYQVLSAKVVTPGLIDAHTVVGLSGYLNQPHDQDQLERSTAIQPDLRAIDAYNGREPLVAWLRGFGVTTIHTGHSPGALISGQTMIIKTNAETVETGVLNPFAMLACSVGQAGLAGDGKPPGTRPKEIAMLRAELIKARDYMAKTASAPDDKKPPRDLKMEALGLVVTKQIPLLVTAHRYYDILAVLRVAKEFDIRIVLDGGAESYLVLDQIKTAGVPVIVHPTMQRSNGDAENLSMETAATLSKANIPFALQSGFEGYVPKTRVVLFEAAVAAANGLGVEKALRSITLDAAQMLGISDRTGSLEAGKDADIVLFDGDPFEYTTHVTGVLIDGKLVSTDVR